MVDGELDIELNVDEDALEDVQNDIQLEGDGGPGRSEGVELAEERNQRLDVINRRTSRIASKVGVLTVIAAGIAALVGIIGQIFDISFGDVRDAVVSAINDLVGQFADFVQSIPTGIGGDVAGQNTINRAQGAALGSPFGLIGALAGATFGDQSSGTQSASGNGNLNVNLFTSRDKMLGDSTQQELEGQYQDEFGLVGGASGGSVPE